MFADIQTNRETDSSQYCASTSGGGAELTSSGVRTNPGLKRQLATTLPRHPGRTLQPKRSAAVICAHRTHRTRTGSLTLADRPIPFLPPLSLSSFQAEIQLEVRKLSQFSRSHRLRVSYRFDTRQWRRDADNNAVITHG